MLSFDKFVSLKRFCTTTLVYTDCPKKKITTGIWVSIAKEPSMESEKSKPDYETMAIFLQFSEDPI